MKATDATQLRLAESPLIGEMSGRVARGSDQAIYNFIKESLPANTPMTVTREVEGIETTQYAPAFSAAMVSWRKIVQTDLHSLSGENASEFQIRREALASLAGDKNQSVMDRGLTIHALGDSYAHTNDGGAAYANWFGEGHALDSISGNDPDLIGIDAPHTRAAENYEAYVHVLFQALKQDGSDPALLDHWLVTVRGFSSGQANLGAFWALRKDAAWQWRALDSEYLGYNPNNPWAILLSVDNPTQEVIIRATEKIRASISRQRLMNEPGVIHGTLGNGATLEFDTQDDESRWYERLFHKGGCPEHK